LSLSEASGHPLDESEKSSWNSTSEFEADELLPPLPLTNCWTAAQARLAMARTKIASATLLFIAFSSTK
jgi:hypothetical protein